MEEAPETDAPVSDAPIPMEVENQGAVAEVEESNPSQEGQGESNPNEFSNPTESSEKDANTTTETSEATPSAESSEISLKLSDSIDSEESKKSSEETEISQKLSDSTETDLTESSKKSSEETEGQIEEETTEKIDEISEEADNAGFGFKISAIASMNAASENLEEMEISEEADKADTAEEATETPEITKDIATLAEDTTKDDLENSKAVPDAPEAETDVVQTENTETEKSKDSIEIEASKDSAEIEASNEPSENQATDENSQETAETAITEPSKTPSTEDTTQNQPKEKDKEEISPTKGLFDKLIEKAPPKKLAQELDSSSKDTGSSHDQDDVEMEDEDSPVPGLRISSIVTMSRANEVENSDESSQPNSTTGEEGSKSNGKSPEKGLKISSFASLSSEGDTEKSDAGSETGLKIASVSGNSPLKIANVMSNATSGKDDDIVSLDDSASKKTPNQQKKPVLKLASFADMSSNGISASSGRDNSESSNQGQPACCSQCPKEIPLIRSAVAWETMVYCDENCLGKYQDKMNNCSTCKVHVQTAFLGKYCVRFGSNIKQFCSNKCLEDHKKGLKVCCYCQKDISAGDGFLAPIGNKGQFKDFCAQECLKKYEHKQFGKPIEKEIVNCSVCSNERSVEAELILEDDKVIKLCSAPCLGAYKFGNNLLDTYPCDLCNKECQKIKDKNGKLVPKKVIYFSGKSNRFCSEACQNVFVMQTREIVPCSWCKVRKYNFDMIEKFQKGLAKHFCSVNCLRLQQSGGSAGVQKSKGSQPVVVSTATGTSTNSTSHVSNASGADTSIPVVQSVSSLAGAGMPSARPDTLPTQPVPPSQLSPAPPPAPIPPPPPQIINRTVTETMVKLPDPVESKNKAISCKPYMLTKGVSCRPHPCHKGTQTDIPSTPSLLPITVPMFMPVPMQMYQRPYPVPVPVPVPIPVPIFIPTTRNSFRGIEKTLKKIRAKMPSDPLEAELLAMAGAAVGAGDNLLDDSDDSLPEDNYDAAPDHATANNHVPRYSEDIENMMSGSNIVPKALPQVTPDSQNHLNTGQHNQGYQANRYQNHHNRGQAIKRRHSGKGGDSEVEEKKPFQQHHGRGGGRSKQSRTSISNQEPVAAFPQPPKERPDAKHHLKFTYGVNAWRRWVVGKNAELGKARSQGKYIKAFETDILKLRADELNYTLCMFVKEVKKPNGEPYASDSIFYLTLGIQECLFENGRIDNIFTDNYYDAFTTALHEVIKNFKLPTNELGYFVTRIEEEHLWEAKQLGAHSPQVLLNTLIYFNVKYFMLKTIEEHKKLSFTHIMKHYKKGGTATPVTRNSPAPVNPGEKQTLLLRYYPPADRGKHQERKCYEQHEIPDQTRCPVKLYEFYLSKCPDSVRTRNDMYYLLPERSCVPDSPVWFSGSQELPQHQIDKMLQRILMVREVQEHMLADQQQ